MGNNRDDFTQKTKEILARRVAYRCSNPECRKPTIGPNSSDNDTVNIGVAAHICAAAKGGKRYNVNMTPEERKGINNGIWLCQNCAKLIDSDEDKYSVSVINLWKGYAENISLIELETNSPINIEDSDIVLIKFYAKCFNRPAFQDPIRQEGYMENFEKAIEDTIIVLNTGILKDRNGNIIEKSAGINEVRNSQWREKLYMIVDILLTVRNRLRVAKNDNLYRFNDDTLNDITYIFYDDRLADWFDSSRGEIINIFSTMCSDVGLPKYHFPRNRYRY